MPLPQALPIRIVLFDAFDTLVKPVAAPYLQYADAARKLGLQVKDEDVKAAFKQAFTETSIEHPNYGLESESIDSPDSWWHLVIQRTFLSQRHSSVRSDKRKVEGLAKYLVHRFGTTDAYTLFNDVVPALSSLSVQSETSPGMRLGLATNSDTRILNVLSSFGLSEYIDLSLGPNGATLSYLEKAAKPDAAFFYRAIARNGAENIRSGQVLYVGDQLNEDFWGATDAGLQALWLQRPETGPGHQVYARASQTRSGTEESAYLSARTISSLSQLSEFVSRSHT